MFGRMPQSCVVNKSLGGPIFTSEYAVAENIKLMRQTVMSDITLTIFVLQIIKYKFVG